MFQVDDDVDDDIERPLKRPAEQVTKTKALRDRHVTDADKTSVDISTSDKNFVALVEKFSSKGPTASEGKFLSARSVFESAGSSQKPFRPWTKKDTKRDLLFWWQWENKAKNKYMIGRCPKMRNLTPIIIPKDKKNHPMSIDFLRKSMTEIRAWLLCQEKKWKYFEIKSN